MPGSTNRPSGNRLRNLAQDQRIANIKRAFRSNNAYSMMKKGGKAKKKSKFPDISGDGKVTKKDILMARGVIKKPMKKKKR
jgi:hypothetical protein